MADSDFPNPFAPAAQGPLPTDSIYQPVPMDVGAILGRSWEIVQRHPGVVIGALLIPLIPAFLFMGAQYAAQFGAATADDPNTALALNLTSSAITILSSLVSVFFQLGVIRIFLQLTRGQSADLSMLTTGGGHYIAAILTSILLGLTVAVGLVLLIIPGMIAAIGLQFALYALVDKDLGPIEALQESWRLTDGYKLTIFAIGLVLTVGALLLTCLTLGLGYLLAVPVLSLVQAVMYHSLTHLQGQGESLGLR